MGSSQNTEAHQACLCKARSLCLVCLLHLGRHLPTGACRRGLHQSLRKSRATGAALNARPRWLGSVRAARPALDIPFCVTAMLSSGPFEVWTWPGQCVAPWRMRMSPRRQDSAGLCRPSPSAFKGWPGLRWHDADKHDQWLWAAEIYGPLIFFKTPQVRPLNLWCFSLFWLHMFQKLLVRLRTANLADRQHIITKMTMEIRCCFPHIKNRRESGKTERHLCLCSSFRRIQHNQLMYS